MQELERLTIDDSTEVSFIELRNADEIESFMTVMDKESLCGALGSDIYWQGLMENPADLIIKAMLKGVVVGFVLIRINYACQSTGCMMDKKWNSFYIELICSNSKGCGTGLINQVKNIARLENIATIHLSSLVDLIPYYSDKHHFRISRDCYPQMETEIADLIRILRGIRQIQNRRDELRTTTKNVRAERLQMNKNMGIFSRQKKSLIDKFRDVSTFQLKHPDRKATSEDVIDEGVYMSFCLPQ